MVCWFFGLSGIWAFVERMGMEVPMRQTSIGILLSLGLGLGALASLAVALIGDRYGRYWPPLAAIAAHVVLCFLFGGQLTAFAYGLMVLLLTFIWNIGLPYLLGLIADSDSTGRMVVLVVTAQAFGNTLGPLVAGQVVELRGLSSVGNSSALFCLLALMILGFFMYRVRLMLSLKPEAIELPI
jgi:predicted MFS family arabinose efflux permease